MKKVAGNIPKRKVTGIYAYPLLSVGLCLISFMVLAQPATASAFTLIKSENNISLYEREVDHVNMKVREVKVEVIVKTDAASLIAFLKNEKQIQQWNTKIDLVKIQKGKQNDNWITYTRIDLPWPLSDQDMVVQYNIEPQNNQSAFISFTSTKCAVFPEKENVSRVNHVAGSWQLVPINEQSAKVIYCIRSERKSSIPKSISDPFIRDNLMTSMNNLKSILEH